MLLFTGLLLGVCMEILNDKKLNEILLINVTPFYQGKRLPETFQSWPK
jgi:hypothetical protein